MAAQARSIQASSRSILAVIENNKEEKMLYPPAQCVKAIHGKDKLPKACEHKDYFWADIIQV